MRLDRWKPCVYREYPGNASLSLGLQVRSVNPLSRATTVLQARLGFFGLKIVTFMSRECTLVETLVLRKRS